MAAGRDEEFTVGLVSWVWNVLMIPPQVPILQHGTCASTAMSSDYILEACESFSQLRNASSLCA